MFFKSKQESKQERRYKFTPAPDITAAEVAEILKAVVTDLKMFKMAAGKKIPDHLARHFSEISENPDNPA